MTGASPAARRRHRLDSTGRAVRMDGVVHRRLRVRREVERRSGSRSRRTRGRRRWRRGGQKQEEEEDGGGGVGARL